MKYMIPILLGIMAVMFMEIAGVELFSLNGFLVGTPFWLLGGLICGLVKDV